MSKEVRDLEPSVVWNHFEDLNAVPRPSKKEGRVISFMKSFGNALGLETLQDKIGNVIIKKPATSGLEDRATVILQAHLDMVHQKNSDTEFDFEQQGINSYINGDWVTADGTTLGADNGMGVAAIMAVLSSEEVQNPPIEALFTVDEETGMTGALELDKDILSGSILLNLDTEEDDELSIGCAGGVDTVAKLKYKEESLPDQALQYAISVKGLKGGHSGMEIHLGRGNANKIMNRLIWNCEDSFGLKVNSIEGGSLRNAIPRESFGKIIVNSDDFLTEFSRRKEEIEEELKHTEPELEISIRETSGIDKVIPKDIQKKVLEAIYSVHNGVYRMSSIMTDLVETSSSLAIVSIKNGLFQAESLQRSSFESSKWDIAATIAGPFRLIGCEVSHHGSYPGWAPNTESVILNCVKEQYNIMFGEEPRVLAGHGGLECGIIGERYPDLDMISFGPTIKNPHSPDEKVNIASVGKFWNFLKAILINSPKSSLYVRTCKQGSSELCC